MSFLVILNIEIFPVRKRCLQIVYLVLIALVLTTALNDFNDINYSEKELHALEKIRESPELNGMLTEDYMKTDFYLIRFLREANLDVETTLDLLDEAKRWREMNNIDTILKEDWSDMLTKFPIDFSSRDVTGRPVMQFVMANWDVRYEIYNGDDERLHRFISYTLERATQEVLKVRAEGHTNVTRVIALVEVNGIGMSQHFCFYCISVWTNWISNLQNYYPKIFDQAVLTNASFVLPLGLNIVWPFMSEESRGLLVTYSESDSEACQKYLDALVPANQRLPEFWGTKNLASSVSGNLSRHKSGFSTRKRFYEEVSVDSAESVIVFILIVVLMSVTSLYIVRLRAIALRRRRPG